MRSDVIYTGSSMSVRIDGFNDIMKWLKGADPECRKAIAKGIRAGMSPVLSSAQKNARGIADDGTFAGSMSIRQRANGSRWLLASNDPAAGVKEFANAGARTITSKGTPLADSRLAAASGVGVPSGSAPRAMVPAVDDNIETVKARIDEQLALVMERASRG